MPRAEKVMTMLHTYNASGGILLDSLFGSWSRASALLGLFGSFGLSARDKKEDTKQRQNGQYGQNALHRTLLRVTR